MVIGVPAFWPLSVSRIPPVLPKKVTMPSTQLKVPPKLTVTDPVEISPLLRILDAAIACHVACDAILRFDQPTGTLGAKPLLAKMMARSPACVPVGSVTVRLLAPAPPEIIFDPRITGTGGVMK